MSRGWLHLTPAGGRAIHGEVVAAHGGVEGIRDETMLESAVAAPRASWGGDPLLTDGIEVAAAYLYYLCTNHPFVDGNKRTALAASLVFLEENGLIREAPFSTEETDAWEALVLEVAAGRIDRAQTTSRMRKLVRGRARS